MKGNTLKGKINLIILLGLISFLICVSVISFFPKQGGCELIEEAILRSGCVIGNLEIPDVLFAGKKYTFEWMIQSYVPINSRFQIIYPDKTRQNVLGSQIKVEKGVYSISKYNSNNYYFSCQYTVPYNQKGDARIGFHNAQDDGKSPFWMFGLFPSGVINSPHRPSGTAGKEFYINVAKAIIDYEYDSSTKVHIVNNTLTYKHPIDVGFTPVAMEVPTSVTLELSITDEEFEDLINLFYENAFFNLEDYYPEALGRYTGRKFIRFQDKDMDKGVAVLLPPYCMYDVPSDYDPTPRGFSNIEDAILELAKEKEDNLSPNMIIVPTKE